MRSTLPLRAAVRLLRLASGLLPRSLRGPWGEALLETSRERVARAWEHGRLPFLRVLAHELSGLVATAVRARRPDAWTRRTARRPLPSPTTWAALMDHLASDVRFALRTFRRRPGMTLLAAGSLALGIGASTAMFSVVDSVLFRALPFPDPEELVSVYPTVPELRGHPTLGALAERGTYSWPEYFALEETEDVFDAMGAYDVDAATLSGEGAPPLRLRVGRATLGLFGTLGVTPLVGRPFTPEDDPKGGARSALLSEDFWEARFAADPAVVGRTLTLDDVAFTVVGVLPAEVEATTPDVDLWVPITAGSVEQTWGNHGGTRAVARLAPGVPLERAAEEVGRLLRLNAPPDDDQHGGAVFRRLEDQTRGVRGPLLVLTAGSLLLLLVGCANVAAILLGAGIDRQQEIAVRGALGAGRGRLGRQLLTESLVLAGVGAAGGVLLGALFMEGLLLLAPGGVPRIAEARLDLRVLAFAGTTAGLSGVLFGMAPALGLTASEAWSSLASARGATVRRARAQSALVMGELALATVLLVSGVLLGRTLLALNRVDPGFELEGLVELRLAPAYQRLAGDDDAATETAIASWFGRLVDELASLPGVVSVAVTSNVPLTGDRGNNDVLPEGWDPEAEGPVAERRLVSPSYFETLGLPIVEGREFTPADDRRDAAPVVIVSRGLADLAWPGEPAAGKRLRYFGLDAEVVGVAADVRDESLDSPTRLAFYVPIRQLSAGTGTLLLRTEGAMASLAPAIRERIGSLDPDLPITRLAPFRENVAEAVSEQRYRARLMGVFAVLSVGFALMGVYGVTARGVARRTREMGIRVALGARRVQVARLVLGQALRLAAGGAALGLAASLFATRWLEGMLFGVGRTDLPSMAGIALLVALGSLAASLPPSRRATRVDPAVALRAD